LDYSISYAEVGQDYHVLADGVTDLSYTALGLTTGTEYKFIVRARNAEGFGPYSTEVIIPCSMVPDPPLMPTVTYYKVPDRVEISWNEPYNRGREVLGYKVLI
jgi:hypothetical protein